MSLVSVEEFHSAWTPSCECRNHPDVHQQTYGRTSHHPEHTIHMVTRGAGSILSRVTEIIPKASTSYLFASMLGLDVRLGRSILYLHVDKATSEQLLRTDSAENEGFVYLFLYLLEIYDCQAS